jgi:hypothetical protein
MLCEGIMLYLMLVLVFSKVSKKWWIFLIIGYGEFLNDSLACCRMYNVPAGLPLIPLVVTLGARYDQYGVRDSNGQLLL